MTKVLAEAKRRSFRHPLAIREGEYKGKLPHQIDEDDFMVWKIEQGMTDEDYEHNLASATNFVNQVREFGKPIKTRDLDDDQRGWAQADHRLHYINDLAKWFINPDKPSKPIPAKYTLRRNREYQAKCECGSRRRKLYWSTRWDGRHLRQCPDCGEVVLAKEGWEPPEER